MINEIIMEMGKRYIVTVPSYDGTFIKGDRLFLNRDGSITCVAAQGWIEVEDLPKATKGMEVKIDRAWIKARKKKLEKELKALDEG
jgi:hypothetical protein